MAAIDFELDPTTWDIAVIAGHGTPGHISISGGEVVWNWDAKAGTGKSGATTIFTGQDLTEITVTLTFADGIRGLTAIEQRREFFTVIVPILEKTSDGKTALDFYHPAVSEPPINLTAVVCKTIGQLEVEDNGLSRISFKLLKYVKPKPKPVGKPAGAKTSADKSSAKDDVDKEIEELTKQLKELG